MGAAIQGDILSGQTGQGLEDIVLVDVIPLSLGIGVKGGLMDKVIHCNKSAPCSYTKQY